MKLIIQLHCDSHIFSKFYCELDGIKLRYSFGGWVGRRGGREGGGKEGEREGGNG